MTAPATLAELLERLRPLSAEAARRDYDGTPVDPASLWPGAPILHGELDWCSLPVFGGEEPRCTDGVWSWDATSLLVSHGAAGELRIVRRFTS